jgi:hypothetical protein
MKIVDVVEYRLSAGDDRLSAGRDWESLNYGTVTREEIRAYCIC